MQEQRRVLVSWVARRNDPYERDPQTEQYIIKDGQPVVGPTLSILFDERSPYRETIADVVSFYRDLPGARAGGGSEVQIFQALRQCIRERNPRIQTHGIPWPGEDPTDHQAIFKFLSDRIPELRKQYAGRELVIHISPGTPSMHTVWVLMAECGFIDAPFVAVKSYRPNENRGGPSAVKVALGIDTFYKVYRTSRPLQVAAEEQAVLFNPVQFRSPVLKDLYREAERYARLQVPILLTGERGTGKTTLASWIRLKSPYHKTELDRRWPSVVCGQYSPETMRAELFGYRKGAFTGADQDHAGLLAEADGDTLFLDEVGDISRDLQRLLIRALEDKTFLPLGHTRPSRSDFRLLTATNQGDDDLGERLDRDFFDRISPVRLRLPALRETPEDLDWLWDAVLARATAQVGVRRPETLGAAETARLVAALRVHPLPGNLRDLFRVAYRLLAVQTDPTEPTPPCEAVDYALRGLEEAGPGDLGREVAQAFARGEPLDGLLSGGRVLETKTLEEALHRYLGRELRRLARTREVSADTLCDVTEKTLYNWERGGEETKALSAKRKKDSSSAPPARRKGS